MNWAEPYDLALINTLRLPTDLAVKREEPVRLGGFAAPPMRWGSCSAAGRVSGRSLSASRLPAVTIVTPESLDPRLSRSPAALRSVGPVTLDELHDLRREPGDERIPALPSAAPGGTGLGF
jgi:hypothetical protein